MAQQPHRGMNQVIMDDLVGLTLDECHAREDEIPGVGDRVGGIGFVRINNARNVM